MKKLFIFSSIILSTIALLLAGHLFYLYTHCEFTMNDFKHNFILKETNKLASSEELLKTNALKILNQPFSYLGCGRQMTAFISEDQQYVIKFFNPRAYLKKAKWFSGIRKLRRLSSLKWISNAYFKRRARLKRMLHRYEMGFNDFREEACLEYVHLNRDTCLSKSIQLFDKQGKKNYIDLDAYPFVLQKKSNLAMAYLDQLMKNGEENLAKERILQLYDLFVTRAQKGYTDPETLLHNNIGFIENRAVLVDLGQLRRIENESDVNQEMSKIFIPIAQSLSSRHPRLAPFLLKLIVQIESQSIEISEHLVF